MGGAIPYGTLRTALSLGRRYRRALAGLLGSEPHTTERACGVPRARAEAIASAAARKAAITACAMAAPPGAFGWLTLPVEFAGVWRIQAQMVADITGAYGRSAGLTQSMVLDCVFERAVPQLARDLALRAGQPLAIRVVCAVGARIGRCTAARGIARVLPFVGAAAAAYCARADTQRVARVAIARLERPVARLLVADLQP